MAVTNLHNVTIANDGTDSTAVNLRVSETVVGIGFTDFTSATISFKTTLEINDTD